MEVKDIDTVVEKLNNIKIFFGIGGVILVITVTVILYLTWKYLVRNSELIAEEASEESLKNFQSKLDIDLVKFRTMHQKQVDAIHETFQKFQKMTSTIKYIIKGEKFAQQLKLEEKVSSLMKFRNEFRDIYHQNRLLFPVPLCNKIDMIVPTVDEFIETFIGGLFPEPSEEDIEFNAEHNGGIYIAGIWGAGTFEEILSQLEQISKEIEIEFRNIYGTNE